MKGKEPVEPFETSRASVGKGEWRGEHVCWWVKSKGRGPRIGQKGKDLLEVGLGSHLQDSVSH